MEINNKFVAYKGCLGRRDFILNTLYLSIISSFLNLPLSWWLMTKAQTMNEMFNLSGLISTAPIFPKFFYIASCLICATISFGFITRRLSDILAEEVGAKIYTIAAILLLIPYVWLIQANAITTLLFTFSIIFNFMLWIIPGKISLSKPHNPLNIFNWGAFWGTWIWGLINKSYQTLWTLLLMLTPAGFAWSLICGIRGNEWAFRKSKAISMERFQQSQRKQAIIWNSLAGFTIFVLPIVLVFVLVFAGITFAMNHPDKMDEFNKKAEVFICNVYENEFESYELTKDENKFYMSPNNWINLTFDERYKVFKGAASIASIKKSNSDDEALKNYHSTRSLEMEKTKIYSSYNGELLAEFNINQEDDITDFKSALQSVMKAMYFNTNPTLPELED